MSHRRLSLFGALSFSLLLAACGGGGGGGGGVSTVPGGGGATPGPGSVAIAPSSLSFTGPGDAPKSFTVSSTFGNVATPVVNLTGCSPVAQIATASTSLPATYTVTPQSNGSCTFVVSVGTQQAAIGVNVGGGSGPSLSQTTSSVALVVGGTAGSVTVSASSGTLTLDATACRNIASIGGSASGPSPQTYTIAPVAAGNCTLTVVDGSSYVTVPITVGANPGGANALTLTPSTLTFASPAAPVQHTTLSFTGNAGSVSFNQDDCIGLTGKPKMAFFTVTGAASGTPIALPADLTVQTYGSASGSCSIIFTSSAGATQAVLSVIVQP